MDRAVRVGVTGKMGSGKSTLAEMMRESGMVVLNTDTIAKELMRNDEQLRQKIVNLLGADAYRGEDLNRQYVASRIFEDPALKRKLESAVHPAVRRQMEYVFQNSPAGKPVVVESALILHSDLHRAFDYVILVEAPDEDVVRRVVAAGRFSEQEVRRRLLEQSYDTLSREHADFTLENTGSPEQFAERARAIIAIIKLLSVRTLPEIPLHQVPDEEEGEGETGFRN